MREGWKVVSVGEIAIVSTGNSAPQQKELFEDGTHLFVHTSDVGKIRIGSINDSANKLNEKGINKLKLFPVGTILFPKSGASTFLNHRVILARNAYASSHLATIKANTRRTLDRYLFHYLTTVKAQDLIQDHKYPSLKISDIQDIRVPLPSIAEQKRIVAILDEAFAGIGCAVANAEKNLINARELFKSYLNAVFTQKSKGWVEKKLGGAVSSVSTGPFGSMLHKSDYIEGGIPIVNPINIVDGLIIPSTAKTVSKKTAKRLKTYVLDVGDIVIARRGEIRRCAVIQAEQTAWLCGRGCFYIKPSSSLNPYFLSNLLRSTKYREKLEKSATGTIMKSLSNTLISRFDELSVETQHLEVLYQQKLTVLAELKQSLLQKAFTGELMAKPETVLKQEAVV